ncbi:HAD family hydrolase [Pelomyxa schiedti]|nr:HAD family hydrolase [Pelomyxa schiedti]
MHGATTTTATCCCRRSKIARNIVTHVVWDLDGTLLDTEPLYTKVGEEIAAMFGKKFDWNVKRHMMGRSAMESCTAMVNALELPLTPQQLLELRNKKQNELWESVNPLPGARRLVEHLHSERIPQAVATGSSMSAFKLKTLNHQSWFSFFEAVVTSDDPTITRGKPHPDIFLRAANKLGKTSNYETVLVIEDAPLGVEAGVAAGMPVVAVPDIEHADMSLFSAADSVLCSLNEFIPEEWGLPPFPKGSLP